MHGAAPAQSPVGICISDALIAKRNLAFTKEEDPAEVTPQALAMLQTIRLDREGIGYIGNLESLQTLHSLYLQENEIQRIENLDCLPCLRFLTLAGNKIQQVENLHGLQQLQLLDLSHNKIATLQLAELPQNLLILNLSGNDCTKQDGYRLPQNNCFVSIAPSLVLVLCDDDWTNAASYELTSSHPARLFALREMVIEFLPQLLDLDGETVPGWEDQEEEDKVTDTQDEFPELSGPFCAERGFFQELEQELARNRDRRIRNTLMEHEIRMTLKPVITDLSLLPGAPPSKSHNPSSVSKQDAVGTKPTTTSPGKPSAIKKPHGLDSQQPSHTVQTDKKGKLTTSPQAKAQGTTRTATIKAKK